VACTHLDHEANVQRAQDGRSNGGKKRLIAARVQRTEAQHLTQRRNKRRLGSDDVQRHESLRRDDCQRPERKRHCV
jgi:hypothetical protein